MFALPAPTRPFSIRVSYSQDRVRCRDRRSVCPRRNYFHGAWQSEITSQSLVSNFEISHAESWLSPNCLMFFFLDRTPEIALVCTATCRRCVYIILLLRSCSLINFLQETISNRSEIRSEL